MRRKSSILASILISGLAPLPVVAMPNGTSSETVFATITPMDQSNDPVDLKMTQALRQAIAKKL